MLSRSNRYALFAALFTLQPLLAVAEEASAWTASSNLSLVSDYYARGISLSWHQPTVQAGLDIAHTSGFYAGVWGSGVSQNTLVGASTELDIYAGVNGDFSQAAKLGYSLGVISYFYPGGSWRKYEGLALDLGKPSGGRFTTTELNAGLSYDWLSAKVFYTLSNWFGAERSTGWDGSTRGSVYLDINAAYPLPWQGWTVIGHLGHMDVSAKLQTDGFPNANGLPGTYKTNPDYHDWKLGLSKAFNIGSSDGWSAGVYWVGASNRGYWGGYGGSSFSSAPNANGEVQTKNLNDSRLLFTLSRAL